uniref:Uncharacterized protein n=1 Tax=Rhizophora mucronata TaxID=61149 RepID=A0A2P2PX00_RHIMU
MLANKTDMPDSSIHPSILSGKTIAEIKSKTLKTKAHNNQKLVKTIHTHPYLPHPRKYKQTQ